jgi:polyferredoxin
MLIVAVVMILHGFFGPRLAPKNLATSLTWIYFRGVLIFSLLCLGNFFCLSCPFMLVRDFTRRFVRPRFHWPRALRNKWLSAGLFGLILLGYELFSWWSSPLWTAWLIIGYFVAATGIDALFKNASFCKFVCPVGQFNFVASLVSPTEVAVRSGSLCNTCRTKDCIRGQRAPSDDRIVIQRGCELALYQPLKVGNMDCTFCLDCVYACPHDNVGILSRLPASELMQEPRRSGVGYFSRRPDLAALVVVFVFGGLWNAFGMITPVYALERQLAGLLHVTERAPVLAILFLLFALVAPLVLLFGTAKLASTGRKNARRGALQVATRYAYSLVPLGAGVWLAHYGFHFLTGALTIVPVVQSALADAGWPIAGEPLWTLTGVPKSFVPPLQMGFLLLGLAGSLMIVHRLAEEDSPGNIVRAAAPWTVLCLLLCGAGLWIILQPMDMRGTFLAG